MAKKSGILIIRCFWSIRGEQTGISLQFCVASSTWPLTFLCTWKPPRKPRNSAKKIAGYAMSCDTSKNKMWIFQAFPDAFWECLICTWSNFPLRTHHALVQRQLRRPKVSFSGQKKLWKLRFAGKKPWNTSSFSLSSCRQLLIIWELNPTYQSALFLSAWAENCPNHICCAAKVSLQKQGKCALSSWWQGDLHHSRSECMMQKHPWKSQASHPLPLWVSSTKVKKIATSDFGVFADFLEFSLP